MPQMMPIYWTLLLIFISIVYFVIICCLSLFPLLSPKSKEGPAFTTPSTGGWI